ncbi:heat-inducible transcriptional repressor HrcA [Clostridium oceanicum]|uniref:Heat-inducible transcription repressor HrcA n=1 Tax=Clostridium oceanicum TaxID=1543 RepID=A0ABN1JVA3_9CLOT
MDERKIRILQAIINDYINSGEPIGSRTIAKKYDLGVSSATIRNEMADLEDMGYLEQIHSSSGRIPSDKGYRLYVDKLMRLSDLPLEEQILIKENLLDSALYEVDKIIRQSTALVSKLTDLACLVKLPSIIKSSLKSLQVIKIDGNNLLLVVITDNGIIKNSIVRVKNNLDSKSIVKLNNMLNDKLKGFNLEKLDFKYIDELQDELTEFQDIFVPVIYKLYEMLTDINGSEIYMEGASNIFKYPEYNDIHKAKEFLSMLNDKHKVEDLLESSSRISIRIGNENFIDDAKTCSVISAVYSMGDKPIGTIGVIGPTRIPYSKIISVINTIVKEMNDILIK